MRFKIVTLACLALFVVTSPVMAKDKKQSKQMDQQAMMEAYMKLDTPGEPHTLFASLAGSWTTKTKSWMEPGKPPMGCRDRRPRFGVVPLLVEPAIRSVSFR